MAPEQGCDKMVAVSASKSVGSDGALSVLVSCCVALARYNFGRKFGLDCCPDGTAGEAPRFKWPLVFKLVV